MNKQDILRFLKDQEDKAITTIKNKCSSELNELQGEVINLMNINFEEIDEMAEYLMDHLQPIVIKIQNQQLWQNHSKVSKITTLVEMLKGKGIKKLIEEDLHTTPRTNLTCINVMQSSLETIVQEHKKVVKNIEGMRGPEATKYLIGLGFKLPEPQYKSISEPLEQVDKSKLFV